MAIVDMLTPEVIKVPLVSRNKDEVLKELVEILAKAGKISNLERALDAIKKREDMGSTGLEEGIAVPHAKTDTVDKLTMAIGISPDGVEFDALDGKPSHIFFLMLAPPDQSGPHIQALAEIARMARSKAFINALKNAKSSEEVLNLFKE